MILEKDPKQKISWRCPFKNILQHEHNIFWNIQHISICTKNKKMQSPWTQTNQFLLQYFDANRKKLVQEHVEVIELYSYLSLSLYSIYVAGIVSLPV